MAVITPNMQRLGGGVDSCRRDFAGITKVERCTRAEGFCCVHQRQTRPPVPSTINMQPWRDGKTWTTRIGYEGYICSAILITSWRYSKLGLPFQLTGAHHRHPFLATGNQSYTEHLPCLRIFGWSKEIGMVLRNLFRSSPGKLGDEVKTLGTSIVAPDEPALSFERYPSVSNNQNLIQPSHLQIPSAIQSLIPSPPHHSRPLHHQSPLPTHAPSSPQPTSNLHSVSAYRRQQHNTSSQPNSPSLVTNACGTSPSATTTLVLPPRSPCSRLLSINSSLAQFATQ